MKVLQISPTYFDDESVIGGGERYAESLSRALSDRTDTTLLAFGPREKSCHINKLRVKILKTQWKVRGRLSNPVSLGMFTEINRADIVHCHQYHTLSTNLALIYASLRGKKTFVSDLGGWGENIMGFVDMQKYVTGFLCISEFSRQLLKPRVGRVIYGGTDFVYSGLPGKPGRDYVLYVGRILPHKGINYLIEAVGRDISLRIVGRPYLQEYFNYLQQLAEGKQVQFLTNVGDDELADHYANALVTVLPSVYKDVYGTLNLNTELLGLVVLESMALGTPVICTRVASLPELVEDGVTGFLVSPNSPGEIAEKISLLAGNPDLAGQMGKKAREFVENNFTWEATVERCLKAYTELGC
ncbi:MAG: glycosyltransferase family 4 protein [Bacillota bacterium]